MRVIEKNCTLGHILVVSFTWYPFGAFVEFRSRNFRQTHTLSLWYIPLQEDIDSLINLCTEDLYRDMMQRQVDFVCPTTYNPNASYLPYRRYLVDWMSDVGEQCRLHNTTIHCSVLFLDKIFRSYDIPRDRWQLIATACITVAAKYEEAEEHCPQIPDLLHLTKLSNAGHTSLSFRDGEVMVLRFLQWRLRAFPPLHVVGYYLSKGVCFEDDTWQERSLIEKIPRYIKKYAEFFCNLTLQDYSFQQYLPTTLAAAILLASRVALQVEPRWRPELVRLTGYEEVEIVEVFHHVWEYYEEQFPGHVARSISPRGVAE
jgi:Cyclin, N-terminal domain/Cyclin, C-terminal domain